MQGAPARIVIPDGWHVAKKDAHHLLFTRTPVAGTVRPVIQVKVSAAADPSDVPSVVHAMVVAAFAPVDGGDPSKVKLPDGWNGGALGQSGVSGQGEVKVGGTAYQTRWRYFEATGGHTRLAIAGACPQRGPDSCDQEFASVVSSFVTSATDK